MKLTFDIAPAEVAAVQEFYSKWASSQFVQSRQRRNINGQREPITEGWVWHALVSCLLTTQQKSGPNSPISRFIRTKPFPLRLDSASTQPNVEAWVRATLQGAKGVRRYNQLAVQIGSNFNVLEGGQWSVVLPMLKALESPHEKSDERHAARVLDDRLAGVGPKQARNLLQLLGLSQHEVPLDSRVTKRLMEFGFPVSISATLLADRGAYEFVLDGFQQVAAAAGIVPCLLDAAIFASFDTDWSEEELIW